MPTHEVSPYEYNSDWWATNNTYTTAGNVAEIRLETYSTDWSARPIATDAVPDYDDLLRMLEDDLEPKPTLNDLVKDADWIL